jgi:PPOX class probable F420-dependent enzyme
LKFRALWRSNVSFWRRSQQPRAEEPLSFETEAATFVEIMGDLGSGVSLDYSPASLRSLEDFIAARFDPPGSSFVGDNLPIGVGCYVGEVVIRNLGAAGAPRAPPRSSTSGRSGASSRSRRRASASPTAPRTTSPGTTRSSPATRARPDPAGAVGGVAILQGPHCPRCRERGAIADAEQVYRAHPTPAEIAEVLAKRLVATVGTLNEDGSIHLAYVLFLHHDGKLYFETSSVTRKARNADQRGRASMIVQGGASTGRSLMVTAEGTATVLRGARAHDLNHRLRAKYIRPGALDGIDRAWGRLDDVAVEITPTRWRSWTGSVLHDETRKELTGSYEDAWLPDD